MSSNNVVPSANENAKLLLGDDSKQSAAKALDELNLVDPETVTKKRGRKPGSTNANTSKANVVLPLTSAEIAFGASIVEGQALAVAGGLALFSTADSAQAIYNLHVKTHGEKLSIAFATLAREYGIEVSGKLAALAQLAMIQTKLARDCWEVWEPKEDEKPTKEVKK